MSKLPKPIRARHWEFNAEFLASNPEAIGEGTSKRVAAQIPELEAVLRCAPGRFPADKWLLSSAVQKLIRRGRAEQAVKAALALHVLDPAYLPRRLPIIAFEDISIGDLRVCFDVLRVYKLLNDERQLLWKIRRFHLLAAFGTNQDASNG